LLWSLPLSSSELSHSWASDTQYAISRNCLVAASKQRMTKYIKLAAVVAFIFMGAPFASAAVISSQLLNESAFPVSSGDAYQVIWSDIGNVASSTAYTGVQLLFTNLVSTSTDLALCVNMYADEATYKASPFASMATNCVNNQDLPTDSQGFMLVPISGTFQGFPYYYALNLFYNSAPDYGFDYALGTAYSFGKTLWGCAGPCVTPFSTTGKALYYQVYSGSPNQYFSPSVNFSGVTLIGAGSTAGFCNTAFSSSTGFLDSIGASISNAACQVFSFLFVPSIDSITQFQSLASTSQSKIPFSYFYGAYDIYSGLTASSSVNLPSWSMDFPAFGSSTPLGTIIPTHVDWFSTTTIDKYYPSTIRNIFLNLATAVIWIGLLMIMYRRIVPHKAL